MAKEIASHDNNEHWKIVRKSEVPEGTPVLPSVWAFRRKRRIATNEVYKWKARINVHGGKQVHGVNYWETYAPVVSWPTVRLFLISMIINKWKSRQIDFVLAFPQADIECDMYMEVPQGFKVDGPRDQYALQLVRNLYGQKQAGRVWNSYMHDGLLARGFVQSTVDMCVYYRGAVSLMIYTDDGIFIGPTDKQIQECFDLLAQEFTDSKGKKHRAFKITDEGTLSDYLGVEIKPLPNGTIKLSQPQMISSILKDLGFNDRTKTKPSPAPSNLRLDRDIDGDEMTGEFHYRRVIGKMNFLEKSTRPDIAYAVHQCARFSNDPKDSHGKAVKYIGKYLQGTQDKGIILNPKDHSFDNWVDADFIGNWNKQTAEVDPSVAKSRTGFIIMYAGCPLVWGSRLQREVALSSTEAEYNAILESMRDVLHLMQLVKDISRTGLAVAVAPPKVHCKIFEDNSGALEMVRLPKMRPRTRHMAVRLHHFREYVRRGEVSIVKVPSRYQLGDLLTKPQPRELFESQRESILQWQTETVRKQDLELPGKHLRACEIIERMPALNQQEALSKQASANNHKVVQPAIPVHSRSQDGT